MKLKLLFMVSVRALMGLSLGEDALSVSTTKLVSQTTLTCNKQLEYSWLNQGIPFLME